MSRKGSIYLIICLLATLTLSSCNRGNERINEKKAITVKTVRVEKNDINNVIEYIGTVEEEQSVSLSFSMLGNLHTVQGREGQFVTKGTILAEMNTQSLKNAYDAALSTLKQAEDGMSRLQMLYDNESLPEVKYIEAKTKLEQAQSMEAIARKNLEDARLIAPFDGIIGVRHVESGENVIPNQPVFTLLKINKVLVKIPVPETEISSIRINDTVNIMIPALTGKRVEGYIREKGVKAHPLSHTYEIRCEVNNSQKELLPGMACRVSLQRDKDNAISIPAKCIQIANDDSKYVWLVSDNTVFKQTVETGNMTEDGVIIIKGLQGGEQVISEGFQKVINGSKVNVK